MQGNEENKKKCRSCGAEIKPPAMFCPNCGVKVESKQAPPEKEPPIVIRGSVKEPGKKIQWLPVTLATVFLILVIAWFIVTTTARRERHRNYEQPGYTSLLNTNLAGRKPLEIKELPGKYLGEGGYEGASPQGNFAWALDLGAEIIGALVSDGSNVYAVVTEPIQDNLSYMGFGGLETTTKIVCLDAGSGRKSWETPLPKLGIYNLAELFISGSDLVAVVKTLEAGIAVLKLDIASGGVLSWTEPIYIEGAELTGTAMSNGTLMVATSTLQQDRWRIEAINMRDGKKVWNEEGDGKISGPGALPGGYAVVTEANGGTAKLTLVGLDSGAASRRSLGFSKPWVGPASADAKIICGGLWSFGRCKVECYSAAEFMGNPVWVWDGWLGGKDPPQSAFCVLKDRCAFLGPLGKLIMIDSVTGTELPTGLDENEEIIAFPISDGNLIYSATPRGSIVAINPAGPAVQWTVALTSGLVPRDGRSLCYRDGRLFCACKGGVLVAVN